jgi:hypothetical protein
METYEAQRRDAINKMKCLKRAEKSAAIAESKLLNEKLELEVLTSAMLFTEVALRVGIIDAPTKRTVQAAIVDDFRKKRKLEPIPTECTTAMQRFASALTNSVGADTRHATATSLLQAYREFVSPVADLTEKEFLRLFLGELDCPCMKFARKAHRRDVFELNPGEMRRKLEKKGAYDPGLFFPATLNLLLEM